MSNREIKFILEKTVTPTKKDWSLRLDDALQAYRACGKPCHLLVKLEHNVFWAVKQCNMDVDAADIHQKLQLNELEEIKNDAYESFRFLRKKPNPCR